jgi:hypothetical protein
MIKNMELAKNSRGSIEQTPERALPLDQNFPGPINSGEQMRSLCKMNDSNFTEFLPFLEDQFSSRILLSSSEIQEEVHFKLMPDHVFAYLHGIYGGTDIRRFSI